MISSWQWTQFTVSVTIVAVHVQLGPVTTLKETFIQSNASVKLQFCELPAPVQTETITPHIHH